MCRPGDPIELRREPENVADERAIAVYSDRGIQLGYLSAERAAWICGMIINGRELHAIFQESTQFGAIVRIAFDGEKPALPAPRASENHRDDPDFYPDEIYPDE
ncbi:HIRAN domain-containing protein [Sphingomonas sp. ZT3P38]|uniref:HIRAN domain-containing protein n=1 Tax=Parasphingomonas zepuensis TaxID=3096161 RepID=UPI002FCADD94